MRVCLFALGCAIRYGLCVLCVFFCGGCVCALFNACVWLVRGLSCEVGGFGFVCFFLTV